jgi:hypothetical protein
VVLAPLLPAPLQPGVQPLLPEQVSTDPCAGLDGLVRGTLHHQGALEAPVAVPGALRIGAGHLLAKEGVSQRLVRRPPAQPLVLAEPAGMLDQGGQLVDERVECFLGLVQADRGPIGQLADTAAIQRRGGRVLTGTEPRHQTGLVRRPYPEQRVHLGLGECPVRGQALRRFQNGRQPLLVVPQLLEQVVPAAQVGCEVGDGCEPDRGQVHAAGQHRYIRVAWPQVGGRQCAMLAGQRVLGP